jgi:hypothetical protein
MRTQITSIVLVSGLAMAAPVLASDVAYIYGRIETVDGDKYQGQLRWGEEEAFWDDLFNADKAENENLALMDPATLERVRSRHWGSWVFFGAGVHDPSLQHSLAVRFGDLRRLEIEGKNDVIAEFRNGDELPLHGGSNDIGARITVADPKFGTREVRWSRIRSIEFMDTPSKLQTRLEGEPIYGTVKSGRYDFTGRIQWDNDETLTRDRLDGDVQDEREHIPFGDITTIRKHRHGALVTLKTGEELYMTGTNDVNGDNRGVVVIVPGLGSVKVGWGDFDEARLTPAPESGTSYAQFGPAHDLTGTVVTREGRFDGRMVFDLDEARDFELLQGMNGDTEYLIPFRDIARIQPRGYRRTDVELRMGLTIELEDGQDVSHKNDGLLIFAGAHKPKYVPWREVTEVVFR